MNAVIRALSAYRDISFDTVYFGGGTPSLLSPGQVGRILQAACIDGTGEVTMECNPGSVPGEYFGEIKNAGVNRLSLGVQSFDDGELMLLGRIHTALQAENAVNSAFEAGIDNIGADLMLGIPGQTAYSLEDSLAVLSRLPVSHVSAYMLKIEKGTPLARDRELLRLIPDDDMTADLYLLAVKRLASLGFEQYEISNFAKPGGRCNHNLKYWKCKEYIGIGPAAHSFYRGKRTFTPASLTNFLADPLITLEEECGDCAPGSLTERFILGMRLSEGFPFSELGEAAGKVRQAAVPMERAGLLNVSRERLALTPKGALVSNEIIVRLEGYLR